MPDHTLEYALHPGEELRAPVDFGSGFDIEQQHIELNPAGQRQIVLHPGFLYAAAPAAASSDDADGRCHQDVRIAATLSRTSVRRSRHAPVKTLACDEIVRSEQACAIAADDLPIPVKGVLGRALLRLEIHVNQAEALTISFRPLEIVHQAPGKIAAHISAAAARAGELVQIALHEIDSLRIVYFAVERDPIGNRGAVLSDHDWELVALV